MNNILNIFKYILSIILIILNIIYIYVFGLTNTGLCYLIYLGLFILFIIILMYDLFKHNKINLNNKYNFICIFVFFVMILVFFRVLFDSNFLFNNEIYKELYLTKYSDIDNLKLGNIYFVAQNSIYFVIFMIILISYHKLNSHKLEGRYSFISIFCFALSLISSIPSIMYLSGSAHNVFFYLVFTVLLLFGEIYSLIKYNHRKKEWIIYLSFFFNMWAFISIFINILYF